MGVSKNNGTPKSSILIRFSIINYPFWGTPIFGNIHITPINGLMSGPNSCVTLLYCPQGLGCFSLGAPGELARGAWVS